MILALLLAAFALPALANGPCHDGTDPQPAMVHHALSRSAVAERGHHRMPGSDERTIVPHVCIGCIPPASIAARTLSAPPVRAGMPRVMVATVFAHGLRAPPILRPPRFSI